jgi:hypothetical protein
MNSKKRFYLSKRDTDGMKMMNQLVSHKGKRIMRRLVAVCMVGAGVAPMSIACSGSDSGGSGRGVGFQGDAGASPAEVDREFAIKAYVSLGDQEPKLLKFFAAGSGEGLEGGGAGTLAPTGDSDTGSDQNGNPQDDASDVRETEQELKIEYDNSGEELDSFALDYARGWTDGYSLAVLAAKTCANINGRGNMRIWGPFSSQVVDGSGFFMFDGSVGTGVGTCDGLLRAQEVMLCTADRLLEIAESPARVVWNAYYNGPAVGTSDPVTVESVRVTIPPQSVKDRFIARDIAMMVLGQIGVAEWFDSSPGTDDLGWLLALFSGEYQIGVQVPTCTDAYLEASIDGSALDDFESAFMVVDALSFPSSEFSYVPHSTNQEHWREVGRSRLELKANILAAAGRLMERAVRGNVRDDMAAAESRRARLGDPAAGKRLFWGHGEFAPPNDYASANHALSTLFEPLGTGKTPSDHLFNRATHAFKSLPDCGAGVSGTYPYQTKQWTSDYLSQVEHPGTSQESLASNLMEAVGILAPNWVDLGNVAPQSLRSVLEDAVEGALLAANPDSESIQSESIESMVEPLGDNDLLFALRRTQQLNRLHPLVSSSTGPFCADVPEEPEWIAAAKDLGLCVVPLGLGVQEVSSWSAHWLKAPFRNRAQCDLGNYGGTLNPSDSKFQLGPVAAFQSPFLFGQVISERLRYLQPGVGEVGEQAVLANAAETDIWAGKGRIYSYREGSDTVIEIHGVDPSEFGRDAETFLQDLRFADPDAWTAPCVAGLRTVGCEGRTANFHEFDSKSSPGSKDGFPVFRFKVNSSGQKTLVLPVKEDRTGFIIGELGASPSSGLITVQEISPLLRELTSAIVEGKPINPGASECESRIPIGLPEAYCIEGMDRDMYVPVANELTSDGVGVEDSWRHYLHEAQEAATRADELGRELIEQGLALTVEKEQAAEEFAELCGVFPSADDVVVEDGVLKVRSSNAAVQDCIAAERYDIMFLGYDPFQGNKRLLKAILCPDDRRDDDPIMPDLDNPASPRLAPDCQHYCGNPATLLPPEEDYDFGLKLCQKKYMDIQVGSLGQTSSYPDPLTATPIDCAEVVQALQASGLETPSRLNVDHAKFYDISEKQYATTEGLLTALSRLRLETWLGGDPAPVAQGGDGGKAFILWLDDTPIMGNNAGLPDEWDDNDNIYPACAENPAGECTEFALMMANSVPRLETAMFHLGALAGDIPPGKIMLPVPAEIVDESDPDNFNRAIPLIALYERGEFRYTGDPENEELYVPHRFNATGPGSTQKETRMGNWYRLAPEFEAAYKAWPASQIHPQWRAESLAELHDFVVAHRFNERISFGPLAGVSEDGDGGELRKYLKEGLRDWVQAYDGTCGFGELATRVSQLDMSPEIGTFFQDGAEAEGARARVGIGHGERSVCGNAPVAPVFATYTLLDGQDGWILGSDPAVEGANNGIFFTHTVGGKAGPHVDESVWWFGTVPYADYGTGPGLHGWVHSAWPRNRFWHYAAFFDLDQDGFAEFPARYNVAPAEDRVYFSSSLPKASFDVTQDQNYPYMVVADERLTVNMCPPEARVEAFIDRNVTNDCNAASAISAALTLSCVASTYVPDVRDLVRPPPINSIDDLNMLSAWNKRNATLFHYVAGAMFVPDVPKQAIDAVTSGKLDTAAVYSGDKGGYVLDLEQAMRGMESGMADVSSAFRGHSLEIQDAILAFHQIDANERERVLLLASESLNIQRDMAIANAGKAGRAGSDQTRALGAGAKGAAAGAAAGAPLGAPGAIVGGVIGGVSGTLNAVGQNARDRETLEVANEYGEALLANVSARETNTAEGAEIERARELLGLNRDSETSQTEMRNGLEGLYSSLNDSLKALNEINSLELRARMLLGKYAGADFVETSQGVIPLELSTVYRRLYDVRLARYERALKESKRAAYLARLAIEQKLGVRMDEINEDIGPMPAPSLWVDDLCGLSGVDYDALADATTDGESDFELTEFADQYIGDYVNQLEQFVEYYNLEYPFRESTDRAVISYRDHSRAADRTCAAPGPNLLLQSGDLSASGPGGNPDALGAWHQTDCESSHCLSVWPPAEITVLPPYDMPDESGPNDLYEGMWQSAAAPPTGDNLYATITVESYSAPTGISNDGPPGWIYQNVELLGGVDYSFSVSAGVIGTSTSGDIPFRLAVYDENWNLVAVDFALARSTETGRRLAERFVLSFSVPSSGIYRAAIGMLDDSASEPLAVGQAQLEQGPPTTYQDNGTTRSVVAASCSGEGQSVRDMFTYQCNERDECFYESLFPIRIDEERLGDTRGVSNGGFSGGNYNYRLGQVAVNVVGTGVLDCSSSNGSCNSDRYVGYDLRHTTQSVSLTSPSNGTTCFDFRTGAIRGGKALAAERVLSTPLSSADSSLILSEGILKAELRGRPLSGTYKLRIWDQPELIWDQVEDIQVLVNYSYWSAVD